MGGRVTGLVGRLTGSWSNDGRPLIRRRCDAWTIPVATTVVVVGMAIVRHGRVSDAEEAVFHAVNGLPDYLRAPMWVAQLVGVLVVAPLVAVVFLLLRRYRLAGAVAALVPLKLFLEWGVIKVLVERERPGATVTDAILRDVSASGLAFPSGHAILAFGVATLLAPYLNRRGQFLAYSLAFANGVARIYLGAHNPLDVVVGAGIGLGLGAALNLSFGVPESTR